MHTEITSVKCKERSDTQPVEEPANGQKDSQLGQEPVISTENKRPMPAITNEKYETG